MKKTIAFIDSQNLYLGATSEGWSIDYRKLRLWLKNKYSVTDAYMFFGYIKESTALYDHLEQCGFALKFREIENIKGYIKGNVDIDMAIMAVAEIRNYDKAYLMTSDGDFFSLVKYLQKEEKFGGVFSPNRHTCSKLLKQGCEGQIRYLCDHREKIGKK